MSGSKSTKIMKTVKGEDIPLIQKIQTKYYEKDPMKDWIDSDANQEKIRRLSEKRKKLESKLNPDDDKPFNEPLTGSKQHYGALILIFIIFTIFLIVIYVPFLIWAIVLIVINWKKKQHTIGSLINIVLIPHFYLVDYYFNKKALM